MDQGHILQLCAEIIHCMEGIFVECMALYSGQLVSHCWRDCWRHEDSKIQVFGALYTYMKPCMYSRVKIMCANTRKWYTHKNNQIYKTVYTHQHDISSLKMTFILKTCVPDKWMNVWMNTVCLIHCWVEDSGNKEGQKAVFFFFLVQGWGFYIRDRGRGKNVLSGGLSSGIPKNVFIELIMLVSHTNCTGDKP